jgi:hypothetical protein
MNGPRFFGHYLVAKGVITPAKLAAASEYQTQVNTRLGEYAIARGLLTESDIKRITVKQLSEDLLFGQAAVRMGLLENTSLNELLAAQRLDHVLIGEALVSLGYTTEEEVASTLAEFIKEEELHAQSLFAVPPEVPMADCAYNLFRVTHLLLYRAWGVRNKPCAIRVNSGALKLSDWNAKATISGDIAFQVAVALPHAVAREWAKQVYERDAVSEADMGAVTRQFTSIVCANLTTTLSNQHINLATTRAVETEFYLPMTESHRAAVMPYVTHNGQIFAAMVYEV